MLECFFFAVATHWNRDNYVNSNWIVAFLQLLIDLRLIRVLSSLFLLAPFDVGSRVVDQVVPVDLPPVDDVDCDWKGGWVVLFIVNHFETPRGGGGGLRDVSHVDVCHVAAIIQMNE